MTRPVEFFRHCLGPAEVASVTATLSSIFITLGPRVGEFERQFAAYLGVEHVVGLSSCSVSLVLALRALGVGPGDEVITTPMTFVATPNAALQVGARPVFADIDPRTGLLDPNRVEAAVTPRTRAILAVGLYGQLAELRALRAIADRHHLWLVDDAAHSIEARDDDTRTGALPDATAFSFYATKNLTCGDGGALAVHDPALAARLRSLRNHGITKDAASRYGQAYTHWDMIELGYKAALTDVQAALLLPQLPHLEERRARRQTLVERYERELAGHEHVRLVARRGVSAHHLFTVQVPATLRDAVLAGLGRRRIGCAVNYRAVHTLKHYRETFGLSPQDFPLAHAFGEQTITLPLYPDLPPDDVSEVVGALDETIREVLAGGGAPRERRMTEAPDLSVVVPVFNEEGNVEELVRRLLAVLEPSTLAFEIVVVDDGSTDGTAGRLRALAAADQRLKVVRFARNFGQEAAVQAGMLRARGRWILQTDGDLQNPPEEIPKLLAKRDEGYEIVYGARERRQDPLHRVLASRLLVWFMRGVLDIRLPEDVTTFRLIRGDVARLIAGLPEKRKFFSALAEWTGARAASVPVAHAARRAGRTKYDLAKLVNHTFDLMVGFSVRPLRLIGTAGAAFAMAGIGFALFRVTQKLLGVDITLGYTSLFSAVVVIGGLQLIALSVIGEYVGRIFIQTQDRPLFRIAEELNLDAAATGADETR